ncbi:MAG: FlaD/FlaE family flagellar protein [Methermicoccaceae archaeon]
MKKKNRGLDSEGTMPNISGVFGKLFSKLHRGKKEEELFEGGETFEDEEFGADFGESDMLGMSSLEEGAGFDEGLNAPEEETGESGENAKQLNELSQKLSKFEMSINTIQRDYNELKETLDKTNQSVLELLSLYELVSNQVNPFVGEGDKVTIMMERLDKLEGRLNDFGEFNNALKNEIDGLAISTKGLAESGVQVGDEKLSEIDVKLDTLITTTAYLDEEVSDLTERVESLERGERTRPRGSAPSPEPSIDGEVEDVQEPKTSPASNGVKLATIESTPSNVVLLLTWIEFLMERVGRNNLVDALDYYVEIGWISEEVASTMLSYARGLDYYVEKPTWRLLPDDHTKSLLFIERLLGNKIDRARLNSVEREMTKVKHGLEELYGI